MLGHQTCFRSVPFLAHNRVQDALPSTVKLTTYQTLTAANSIQALQQIVDGVAAGRYRVSVDRVFRFNEIVEAHRYMEENRAKGKLVVVVDYAD